MSSTDYTKLLARLLPDAGGEDTLRMRVGVVSAVNVNGTLDVIVSGQIAAGVAQLDSSVAGVGDVVQMITYRGQLLVIGTVNNASASGVEPVVRVASQANGVAIGNTESVIFTLPSFTYKAGRAYTLWLGGGVSFSDASAYVAWNVKKGTTTAGALVVSFLRDIPSSGLLGNAVPLDHWATMIIGATDVTTQLVLTQATGGSGFTTTMVASSATVRHLTILPAGYASKWTNASVLS